MAAAVTSKYLTENPNKNRENSPIIGTYLVYPGLAAEADPNDPDVAMFADTNGLLPLVTVENFRNLYAGTTDKSARQNYLFAPALTPDHVLQRYPASTFVLAKYDVLAKESISFARRLEAFGIPVQVFNYQSTIHAFFGKEIVSPFGRKAVTESCNALLKLLKLN
jgi:acetyl esterase/lipase